jgi:hypothetical protein
MDGQLLTLLALTALIVAQAMPDGCRRARPSR